MKVYIPRYLTDRILGADPDRRKKIFLKSRGKGIGNKMDEAFPFHAIEEHSETGGKVPLILNLGTRWKAVASFTPRPLYPSKTTQVPTEMEVGWAPEPVWAFYRREISTFLPEIRTLNPKKY
jgi:hypothetical protein